jgi:hypothetical protein
MKETGKNREETYLAAAQPSQPDPLAVGPCTPSVVVFLAPEAARWSTGDRLIRHRLSDAHDEGRCPLSSIKGVLPLWISLGTLVLLLPRSLRRSPKP